MLNNESNTIRTLSKLAYKTLVSNYRYARNLAITGMEFYSEDSELFYKALIHIDQQFDIMALIPQGFDKYHPDNDFVWLIDRASSLGWSQDRVFYLTSSIQMMSNDELDLSFDEDLKRDAKKRKNNAFYLSVLHNLMVENHQGDDVKFHLIVNEAIPKESI